MGKRAKVSTGWQLKKCSNRRHPPQHHLSEVMHDDRISQLPDEILVFILSLLTLKEAARTSVLSSRWINLWKYTPRLDFDASASLDSIKRNSEKQLGRERVRYVNWVNRIMQLHQGLTLDEFRLCFDLDISSQTEIDKWLEYAFTRTVERLEVDLSSHMTHIYGRHPSQCCNFPDRLLNLDNGLSKLIEFGSLRVLCLKYVNITGEAIESFLHNCRFLERLVVVGSGKLVNLLVSGSSLALKHLDVDLCHNVKSIKICDCNLVSLGICKVEHLVLMNVPMLVELFVRAKLPEFFSRVFSQFSLFSSQLERLELKDPMVQTIVNLHDFPQLSQLKELVIYTVAWDDYSLMGVTSFIKECPNLRKFVLQLAWATPSKRNREKVKGAKCALIFLEVIELHGYCGRTSDVELLMYFVENAAALEKIVIDPRCQSSGHLKYNRHSCVRKAVIASALKEVKQLVPKHIELVIL